MRQLKFDSAYKGRNNERAFPEKFRNTEDYFRQCAEAILYKYINNKCAVPYDSTSGRRSFEELRLYAQGKNSPDKYKSWIVGKPTFDKATGKWARKTTMNISWDILQILPEKLDVVRGFFKKMIYDITTSAIDYQATVDKQLLAATAKLMTDDRLKLMIGQVNQTAGGQMLINANPASIPTGVQFNSPQDVDLFASVGGFFLEQEAALKILLDKSMYESSWDGIIDKITDDLLALAIAGTRTYTEPGTMIVKSRYVDPDAAIIPFSLYDDYRDITYGAEIRSVTINELRRTTSLTDKDLIEIARAYATDYSSTAQPGFFQNAQSTLHHWRSNDGFSMNMIDQIKVDVVDCAWIAQEDKRFTVIEREGDRNMVIRPVGEDYQLTERSRRSGKRLKEYTNQTVLKASLVLGTHKVFDYGHEENIAYRTDSSGRKHVVFPYKFVRTGNSSLVERCIGFVDDANLSNYKLRNAKRAMPAPPNLMIKKNALEGVKINGVSHKPTDLIKLFQDQGFLIVDDQNPWGDKGSQGKAIDVVPTDIVKQLAEWRLDIEFNIMMIEKVTGVNDIFSAQTPSAETGLGVSRLAIAATSNALYPITAAREYMLEQTMRIVAKKWLSVARYIPEEQRKRLSINRALKYVKIGADLDKYDYDIKIEAAPTEDDKLQLLQDIARQRDMRRQAGFGGITGSDYMLIWSMIKNGNIRQAQIVLAQIEDMRAKEDQEAENKRIFDNARVQQESNQQTAENEAALNQQEADLDLRNQSAIERQKASQEAVLEYLKSRNELRVAASQNIYGWGNRAYTRPNK